MTTLKEWIEEAAEGEPIIGVVLGRSPYNFKEFEFYPENKLLTWEKALQYLQFDFCGGYGSQGHFPIHAWTKSWVIGTDNYDGSTSCFRIPRNPCDCVPCEPGGG